MAAIAALAYAIGAYVSKSPDLLIWAAVFATIGIVDRVTED